ncbi:ABC transporter permease [Cnuibacter sp. UC19_7]|uniref:ABC transporter permease n=1 Tax=Cnuibacter sp. UC19_7 TaxID=3350166 RepID=UPI003670A1A4
MTTTADLASESPEAALPRQRSTRGGAVMTFIARNNLWIALVVLVGVLILSSESFRNPANLSNILMQNAIIGVVSIGMLVMMISGGFDLSVGAAGGAVGMLTAFLSNIWGLPLAILAGVVLGMLIGLINGVIIARLRINSFITTFAIASVITGIMFVLTSGQSVVGASDALTEFAFQDLVGIPVLFIAFVVFAVLTSLILTRTKWGHWLYSVGANPEASYLSGIPVLAVKVAAFVFGGLAVGLGGIFLLGQSAIGQPNAATGWPLDAIAICVIAGTSLSGGIGRVSNVVAAVLVLGVVSTGMNQLGISPYWQPAVTGAIILVAVIADQLTRNRSHG